MTNQQTTEAATAASTSTPTLVTDTATAEERAALASALREMADAVEAGLVPMDGYAYLNYQHSVRAETIGGHRAALDELEAIAAQLGVEIDSHEAASGNVHHVAEMVWGTRPHRVECRFVYIDERTERAEEAPAAEGTADVDDEGEASSEAGQEMPTRLLLDEDCPSCGWPETYAEVDFTSETPGADAHGCSKCGWRTDTLTADDGDAEEPPVEPERLHVNYSVEHAPAVLAEVRAAFAEHNIHIHTSVKVADEFADGHIIELADGEGVFGVRVADAAAVAVVIDPIEAYPSVGDYVGALARVLRSQPPKDHDHRGDCRLPAEVAIRGIHRDGRIATFYAAREHVERVRLEAAWLGFTTIELDEAPTGPDLACGDLVGIIGTEAVL